MNNTHRLFALALTLSVLPTPPATAWNVTHDKDRMTDKPITWASVEDKDATLLVGCMNGQVSPRLAWGKRIGWGDVGVSYRFDDGPVVPRMAMVSQDGRVLYAWDAAAVARMRAAKRVRVTLGQAFYDFDLTKGDALPAKGWGC